MKSLKQWKMNQLLTELADVDSPAMKGSEPNTGGFSLGSLRTAMGAANRKVDPGDRSGLKTKITQIHKENGGNPLETLSDVVALTFSIVAPQMGSTIGRGEVMDFVKQFMTSQAEGGMGGK